MKRLLRTLDARDAITLLGAGLVTYGLWQIYQPAAFIAPGAGLVWLGIWKVR